ncbi:putative small integral membrane protein [Afipia felis]|uniref:Small integral membrane protein n=1 Tax=Afipia felis TaxID=1035 RepID=A0A090MMT5_AFIFE|nr:low affinity iron permease family protein [Afipia felis]CEG06974.1 putative small integral membrane protein [Afipia felis]
MNKAAKSLSSVLTNLGALSANPIAFATVILYAGLWIVFDRESLNWHGAATLATWMMTLFIQRSEHRDTQAIHAKLDELLRADEQAEEGLARIDEEEPEDIEKHREHKKS